MANPGNNTRFSPVLSHINRALSDGRVKTILRVYFVLVVITLGILFFARTFIATHLDGFFISFMSSWIGDLLFFFLVGSVVWYLALRNPEEEDFTRRVKILYGDKLPESVFNYNIEQIRKLAGYSPHAERTIMIERYDPVAKAYYISVQTKYVIRNALDALYEDECRVSIDPDASDNLSEEVGRVRSIRVGNERDLITSHSPITKKDGYNTKVTIKLEKYQEKEFCSWWEIWALCGSEYKQNMKPQRAVEHFYMKIISQCVDNVNPRIRHHAASDQIITLLPNEPYPFPTASGVHRDEIIFEFEFVEPATPAEHLEHGAMAACVVDASMSPTDPP